MASTQEENDNNAAETVNATHTVRDEQMASYVDRALDFSWDDTLMMPLPPKVGPPGVSRKEDEEYC